MMNNEQKKTAVLFVHGLQGSPGQFDFLVSSLPEGTAYRNLLLPGHGGTLRQFRRSGREAWTRCVQQAAVALGQEFDRVVFVGHSMGCLLGLKAAMLPGVRFSSMLFIACPFRLRLTLRYARIAWRAAGKRPTDDPAVLATRKANSVRVKHPLLYLTCLHPQMELLRLIREIRRIRKKPLLRVTAAFPEKDEIVSPQSVRIAREDWHFAPVEMPLCSHNGFTPEAQEVLRKILRVMIQS